jgi:DNA-binding transcriptional ArsR family regulator
MVAKAIPNGQLIGKNSTLTLTQSSGVKMLARVKIMRMLKGRKRAVTAEQIAQQTMLSKVYVQSLLKQLVAEGWVEMLNTIPFYYREARRGANTRGQSEKESSRPTEDVQSVLLLSGDGRIREKWSA